jgi:predicted dehydrogenase
LGTIRLVQVEYVQVEKPMKKTHACRAPGNMTWCEVASLVMGDMTHAHDLTRFMTGQELAEVSAEIERSYLGASSMTLAGHCFDLKMAPEEIFG